MNNWPKSVGLVPCCIMVYVIYHMDKKKSKHKVAFFREVIMRSWLHHLRLIEIKWNLNGPCWNTICWINIFVVTWHINKEVIYFWLFNNWHCVLKKHIEVITDYKGNPHLITYKSFICIILCPITIKGKHNNLGIK